MRTRIDSALGRLRYRRRFATVEPVFGNIRHNKRLNRFTLRRRHKVDGQWKLFALVHNIEKWANLRKVALQQPRIRAHRSPTATRMPQRDGEHGC